MRDFAFISSVLMGCLILSGIVTTAQAKTGAGGIQLLSFLPEREVQQENRFWRDLLDKMADCEAAVGPETNDSAIALGSGCPRRQTPKAPAPQPGKVGA